MQQLEMIQECTIKFRQTALNLFKAEAKNAAIVPPGWKNNMHWHLGHLIITPYLLTHGLLQEDLGELARYRDLFGKDSTPLNWRAEDNVPPYDALLEELMPRTEALFQNLEGKINQPFAAAYTTSPGVVLSTPLHALNFSQTHDGIHAGLLFALRRALR